MTERQTTRLTQHFKALDIVGAVQLSAHGTADIIRVTEQLHLSILERIGFSQTGPLSIVGKTTRLIYRGIRLAPEALATHLGPLSRYLPNSLTDPNTEKNTPQRKLTIAALNGVWGDRLHASHNPLRQPLTLHELDTPYSTDKTTIFIHGLCMDEAAWLDRYSDQHFATDITEATQSKPLLVSYNTGRSISNNGAAIAEALDQWFSEQGDTVKHISIVGHSMGGLVARSALEYAQQHNMAWRKSINHLVCLGTPHLGAPLERMGHWLENLLSLHPYTMPFIQLTQNRSDGIKDLRLGRICEDSHPIKLPEDIKCFAIAGQVKTRAHAQIDDLLGDGLVNVDSAFGLSNDDHKLDFPPENTWLANGVKHLSLLTDPGVNQKIIQWLKS